MTEGVQPTSGSLEARIIRACKVHATCALDCPKRQVEDLGEIASFDLREEQTPSPIDRLKHWIRHNFWE